MPETTQEFIDRLNRRSNYLSLFIVAVLVAVLLFACSRIPAEKRQVGGITFYKLKTEKETFICLTNGPEERSVMLVREGEGISFSGPRTMKPGESSAYCLGFWDAFYISAEGGPFAVYRPSSNDTEYHRLKDEEEGDGDDGK